jgi:hypothetical protein
MASWFDVAVGRRVGQNQEDCAQCAGNIHNQVYRLMMVQKMKFMGLERITIRVEGGLYARVE